MSDLLNSPHKSWNGTVVERTAGGFLARLVAEGAPDVERHEEFVTAELAPADRQKVAVGARFIWIPDSESPFRFE